MKHLKIQFIFIFFLFLVGSCGLNHSLDLISNFNDDQDSDFTTSGIYGEDGRRDLYQVKNSKIKLLEKSTLGLTPIKRMSKNNNGNYNIKIDHYGKNRNLCKEEPFWDQQRTTICSAFLVSEDTIVTAGHCVYDQNKCEENAYIFGLSKYQKNKNINYTNFPSENIFFCKELIYSVNELNGEDFAVIRLDRPVSGRKPLSIRKYGSIKQGDPLVLIGKPSGIPTKVDQGGFVHSLRSNTFITTVDAYVGNSGSAVFNKKTNDVEGILVTGGTDYYYDSKRKCSTSYLCDPNKVKDQTECRGEGVQKIANVLPYLEKMKSSNIYRKDVYQEIPDDNIQGLTSELTVEQVSKNKNILIHLDIEHTWIGDLTLSLISPSNEEFILIRHQGEGRDNLKIEFGEKSNEQALLQNIFSTNIIGLWKLKVVDGFSRDKGIFISWAIEFK